jgi:hypothetical protein
MAKFISEEGWTISLVRQPPPPSCDFTIQLFDSMAIVSANNDKAFLKLDWLARNIEEPLTYGRLVIDVESVAVFIEGVYYWGFSTMVEA